MTDMEVYMEGLDGAIDVDLDGIRGPRGYTGVGIESVVLNPDFTLTITLTDDSVYTTAPIRGEKGETGNEGKGIINAYVDGAYKLHLRYTDGSEFVSAQSIRGPRGLGMRTVSMNENDGLHIVFDDAGTRLLARQAADAELDFLASERDKLHLMPGGFRALGKLLR